MSCRVQRLGTEKGLLPSPPVHADNKIISLTAAFIHLPTG